jgi:SAM-dependent methyltransferase
MLRLESTRFSSRIDLAYWLEDPWNLGNPVNRQRYEWTSALIAEKFGRPRHALEIGCGEGFQTPYLLPCCERLTAIDVSGRAIRRARKRNPGVACHVGDPFENGGAWRDDFDLVIACEVLYFARDPRAALSAVTNLGKRRFVTAFAPSSRRLWPHVERIAGGNQARFDAGDRSWLAAWW